jgi:hypothetical protein
MAEYTFSKQVYVSLMFFSKLRLKQAVDASFQSSHTIMKAADYLVLHAI